MIADLVPVFEAIISNATRLQVHCFPSLNIQSDHIGPSGCSKSRDEKMTMFCKIHTLSFVMFRVIELVRATIIILKRVAVLKRWILTHPMIFY